MRDYATRDRADLIAGRVRTITEDERIAIVRATRAIQVRRCIDALGQRWVLHKDNAPKRREE